MTNPDKPDVRLKGYRPALTQALEKLKTLDLQARANICEARVAPDSASVTVPFFGRELTVSISDGTVTGPDGQASVMAGIILLHYLTGSSGTPPSGNMVTFREVPEGNFYFHSFHDRALKPLIAAFGADAEGMRRAGRALGWSEGGETGDVCLTVNALPLVPVRFVVWTGDDELAPEASILFDSNIPRHLHTEDIALLAEEGLGFLINNQ